MDLLADGQSLGEKPSPLVFLGDLFEGLDGPVALAEPDIEVSDDVERADVLRVALGELFIFRDSFADPADPDVLLGLFDDLDPIAARAHGDRSSAELEGGPVKACRPLLP